MRYFLPLVLLALAGAGCGPKNAGCDESGVTSVKLLNGQTICAEVELNPADMQKGMMFRDSLARGRGMLFIHDKPGLYTYWMFQVKIPLDIIWMDSGHHIVEISPETPPCRTEANACPTYGGHQQAQFVLELGGGEARRLGLRAGNTLEF